MSKEPSILASLQQKREAHETAQDMAEISLSAGIACLSRNTELSGTPLPLWAELLGGSFIAGTALAESTRLAYHNADWIAALDAHIIKLLKHADFEKIKKNAADITQADLKKACLEALKSEITKDVAYTGLLQSLSLASVVFSAGQLSPPTFAITALLSLGIFVTGAVTTAIMTYRFRQQVEQNCMEFFKNKAHEVLLEETLERLKTMKHTYKQRTLIENIMHYMKKLVSPLSYATQVARILQDALSVLKSTVPILNLVTQGVMILVGPITNYWTRQRYLLPQNKAAFKNKAVFENIFARKYVFFGKSKLDLFRAAMKKENKVFSSVADEHQACQAYYQDKAFNEFKKNKKSNVSQQGFEMDKIRSFVKKDVLVSGLVNTFYVSSFCVGLGMLVPPLLIPCLAIAAIAAVVGCITTAVVAQKEAKKFEKAFSEPEAPPSSLPSMNAPEMRRFSELQKPGITLSVQEQNKLEGVVPTGQRPRH